MPPNRPRKAFVLMPFAPSFEDVYKLGIKGAAQDSNTGIEITRLDEQLFAEGMLERIYREIDDADVIVADLSDKNANVFYELGYAHAKDKFCVLLTNDPNNIPFDLRHRRHIVYGSVSDLRIKLADNLRWAKTVIDNQREPLRLDVQATGMLEKTNACAEGKTSFRLDIHCPSDGSPTEISAIYYYASDQWTVRQNNIEAPSIGSDITPYTRRYLLTPPVQRLERGAWIQIKWEASRVLAWVYEGPLRDSYSRSGDVLVRVMTNRGTVPWTAPITVKYDYDDIPF